MPSETETQKLIFLINDVIEPTNKLNEYREPINNILGNRLMNQLYFYQSPTKYGIVATVPKSDVFKLVNEIIEYFQNSPQYSDFQDVAVL